MPRHPFDLESWLNVRTGTRIPARFQGCSKSFMDELIQASEVQLIRPFSKMMTPGTHAPYLCLILKGRASAVDEDG